MNSETKTESSKKGNLARMSLRIVLALAIAVTGIVIYQAKAHDPNEVAPAAPAPPTPRVTVATVESLPVVEERELLGRVDAMETVEVRPRVSGHIEEVRLSSGAEVKKGDVLFVIDSRWYAAARDMAQSTVERAKVRVGIAERDARRSEGLLKSRAISVEEAETRTSMLAEARAELLVAEASLVSTKLDLEHTEVRAPISGRISRALVTEGNLVSGSPGGATLLTTIVSGGDMYVYADVDEATLLTFQEMGLKSDKENLVNGRIPVTMQLTGENGYPHRGYVESLDNRLDPKSGSLILRMVFPNEAGKLLPGLAARVMLPISAANPKMLVQERAIGTNQSQKFVMTVDANNTVVHRTVRLGPMVQGKRVIREGLQPGDKIIVNGLQRVAAGMTVMPETAAVAMK